MKRLAALILAALLALAAVSAVAEEYTLAEKFCRQAFEESAYRGTVTLAVTGNSTAAIDQAAWTVLKSLAPRLSLSVEHATTAGKDEGQATLTLTLDGQTSAKHTFLYDQKLIAFSGTLLGGDSVYYSAARGWNAASLLNGLMQKESAWPPVWRIVMAVETAPEEWKTRAADRIALYETKLGLWLNGYASFTTGRENNIAYSQLSCQIPAQAVKAEIKQLMVDLYADSQLLSLLREVVTAEEAAAYLQPSAMNTLFALIDGLNLDGNVQVIRRYDAAGSALLDSVTLPFPAGSPLSELTVSSAPQEGGANWTVQGKTGEGTEFDVSCFASDDMIFTGSVKIVMPEEEKNSFVVSDASAPERKTVAFDYNLMWEPGEDTYTLSTDRFAREIKGSLLIRPLEGSDMPDQSLKLELTMSSGSSKRSATQLNGSLTWQDLDSGASVSAVLTSRTVSPFAYTTPSALTGAMRVDQLTSQSLAAVAQGWIQRATTYLTTLVMGGAASPIATVQPR